MIDWYRAAFRFRDEPDPDQRVAVPAKIVFGEQDRFNDPRSGPESERYCTSCQYVGFPDAGHWILLEEPEATSRLLIEFFSEP
jgi:pimeloyl-ACP methyl ester carboxylesterase